MKPERITKVNYIYYERNKKECPICEYGIYNEPINKKKGSGWYTCTEGKQTRINMPCRRFKQRKEDED